MWHYRRKRAKNNVADLLSYHELVIGDQICDTIAHFSNSCLLNIYNLLSKVYPLVKFQPHMLIYFGVTALQSRNNRNIDLYSKYRENILQAFAKMVVI